VLYSVVLRLRLSEAGHRRGAQPFRQFGMLPQLLSANEFLDIQNQNHCFSKTAALIGGT
jgi:hypothetical protein